MRSYNGRLHINSYSRGSTAQYEMHDVVAKLKNRIQKLWIVYDKENSEADASVEKSKSYAYFSHFATSSIIPKREPYLLTLKELQNSIVTATSWCKLPGYLCPSQANCWELPSVMLVTKTIPNKWLVAGYNDRFMHSTSQCSRD